MARGTRSGRIESVSLNVPPLEFSSDRSFESFLTRVAPHLRVFKCRGISVLSETLKLDPSKIEILKLKSLEVGPYLPVLRAGCPKLRELSIYSSSWTTLVEALEIVASWKNQLSFLSVDYASLSIPGNGEGYAAVVRNAVVAHKTSLQRINISSRREQDEAPCVSVVVGSWGWDISAWPSFASHALATIGVPLHKIKIHNRRLFQLLCWDQNGVDHFATLDQVALLWTTVEGDSLDGKVKCLSSALSCLYDPGQTENVLETFVLEKVLQLFKDATATDLMLPRICHLILQAFTFLVAMEPGRTSRYFIPVELLVSKVSNPVPKLLMGDFFLVKQTDVLSKLLKFPSWRLQLVAALNDPLFEPISFALIRAGEHALFKTVITLLASDYDPTIKNAQGQTALELLLELSAPKMAKGAFGLFQTFCESVPQSILSLSPKVLLDLNPNCQDTIAEKVGSLDFFMREDVVRLALTEDRLLMKLFYMFDTARYFIKSKGSKVGDAFGHSQAGFSAMAASLIGEESCREALLVRVRSLDEDPESDADDEN